MTNKDYITREETDLYIDSGRDFDIILTCSYDRRRSIILARKMTAPKTKSGIERLLINISKYILTKTHTISK